MDGAMPTDEGVEKYLAGTWGDLKRVFLHRELGEACSFASLATSATYG